MINNVLHDNNKRNSTPILYEKKGDCCGCAACVAICPQDAIDMIEDEEGFDYPVIKDSLCIKCFRCIRVCPVKEAKFIENIDKL